MNIYFNSLNFCFLLLLLSFLKKIHSKDPRGEIFTFPRISPLTVWSYDWPTRASKNPARGVRKEGEIQVGAKFAPLRVNVRNICRSAVGRTRQTRVSPRPVHESLTHNTFFSNTAHGARRARNGLCVSSLMCPVFDVLFSLLSPPPVNYTKGWGGEEGHFG